MTPNTESQPLLWWSRWSVVRLALGLLLVAAAALKLYGINVSSLPRIGWFSTPAAQIAAAEWELVLGLWLISGRHRLAACLAAIMTFSVLAAVSFHLGLQGVTTCGCFGTIEATPWHALAADVAVLLLMLCSPELRQIAQIKRVQIQQGVASAASYAVGVAALLGASALLATWLAGSPQAFAAQLRGEPITPSPFYVHFGQGVPGQILEGEVTVHNFSKRSVRIVGGTEDCSFDATSGLPLTIPAHESRTVPLRLLVKKWEPGALTRWVELWTDHDEQRTVRVLVGCVVAG